MDVLLRLLLVALIGSSSLLVPHRAAIAASGRSTRAPRVQRAQVQDAHFKPPVCMASTVQLEDASSDGNSGKPLFLPARTVKLASLEPAREAIQPQLSLVRSQRFYASHLGRSPPGQF